MVGDEGSYLCEIADTGDGALATTSSVALTVNEYPVLDALIVAVDENSDEGASVVDLDATDQNVEQSVGYAIVGGDPDHHFRINSATGEISVSRAGANQQYGLNHEHK